MTQTVNGRNNESQKQTRPGQRQQERLMRFERRRRRRRIITSIVVAVLLVAIVSLSLWQYQNYTTQQAVNRAAQATVTAKNHAAAVATATTQDCFVSPPGTKTSTLYASAATPTAGPAKAPLITGTPVKLKDGLEYVDIVTGTGPAAKAGDTVNVEYTGWLDSTCTKFDSSYDRKGQSFAVTPLGKAQVIPGWNEGLIGMKAGGTRRLLIPSALAYGAQGAQGAIPPNATLIFDVTVVSIK
ncbi:MAG TPA: FKBP-type peptidyl-prolyl cis-trans isomerase [Ktedonobacteraceae bacterium]|nr:FKBP-type peptidyl-prolyl cis-trans isomerase [Ktedonobacteraceae bacterium]